MWVESQVESFLLDRARDCETAGISKQNILLDPGFGFGKNLNHNLELLRQLSRLSSHGYPLVAGLSRKSMLARITGREVNQRLVGSVTLAVLGVLAGAAIVRVHDVAETHEAIKVLSAVWPQAPESA